MTMMDRESDHAPLHRKQAKRRILPTPISTVKIFLCCIAICELLSPSRCSAFNAYHVIVSLSSNLQGSSLGKSRHSNSLISSHQRFSSATDDDLHDGKNRLPPSTSASELASSVAMNRRDAIFSTAAAMGSLVMLSAAEASSAASADESSPKKLEDLDIGEGRWTKLKDASTSNSENTNKLPIGSVVPASFAAYASRFLIVYDTGVSSWWRDLSNENSLLPDDQASDKMRKEFASFAYSVQLALDQFVQEGNGDYSTSPKKIQGKFGELATMLLNKYGENKDARRQISLLFATLPRKYQPTETLEKIMPPNNADSIQIEQVPNISSFTEDLSTLLPPEYNSVYDKSTGAFAINPIPNLKEFGANDDLGQSALSTPFGPVASTPLQRDNPKYGPDIYALFGISGGVGCALTHTAVIPLDVVKTRLQTNPDQYDNIFDGAVNIVKDEGVSALLLGAQATIAGYLWYGISVYPSYTFFKRFLGHSVLSPEMATIHANDVALIAGALAAVLASIGLTPLEACRIRTVAEPDVYRSKGLIGTMGIMAQEDPTLGWKALYAGFPSLVTRQVIFGSVKFLAFERACEAIFSFWPELKAATVTSLAVSLVAGGISGTISSVVSQPADSVLTYVAQQTGGGGKGTMGVIEGCKIMIEREGVGSLFRGCGSRCIWAGSIIAGQFLLYDVFRTMFGVNRDDLSQVFEVVISGQNSLVG